MMELRRVYRGCAIVRKLVDRVTEALQREQERCASSDHRELAALAFAEGIDIARWARTPQQRNKRKAPKGAAPAISPSPTFEYLNTPAVRPIYSNTYQSSAYFIGSRPLSAGELGSDLRNTARLQYCY